MKYFSPSFSYMWWPLSRRCGTSWKSVLRDENRAAADLAGVEIVEGVEGGVGGVLLGVQRDLSGLRQDHQLGQVVVGADDVSDDVLLACHEVRGGNSQLTAVTDDVLRA